jgi:hypothetical protein
MMAIEKYTEDQICFLEAGYPIMSVGKLTKVFNKYFGTSKTVAAIKTAMTRRGIKSGRTGRFARGGKPWNTGTRGVVKPNAGCFKPGSVPPNIKSVGHERIGRDGYVLVKVEGKDPLRGYNGHYRHKHVVVWEEHNGEVPDGFVICFIDGDRRNFEIDNLELVSRGELAVRNMLKMSSKPSELRAPLATLAKLIIKKGELVRKK